MSAQSHNQTLQLIIDVHCTFFIETVEIHSSTIVYAKQTLQRFYEKKNRFRGYANLGNAYDVKGEGLWRAKRLCGGWRTHGG